MLILLVKLIFMVLLWAYTLGGYIAVAKHVSVCMCSLIYDLALADESETFNPLFQTIKKFGVTACKIYLCGLEPLLG